MFINGVKIESLNELRDNIVKHFGSLSAFSQSTGYSYRLLKKALINLEFSKEDYEEIESIYIKENDPDNIPFRISKDDIESIRMAILSNFKKVTLFCKKHPEYNSVYISNIVNGKLKLKSKKYKGLVKLLKKKYGLN